MCDIAPHFRFEPVAHPHYGRQEARDVTGRIGSTASDGLTDCYEDAVPNEGIARSMAEWGDWQGCAAVRQSGRRHPQPYFEIPAS